MADPFSIAKELLKSARDFREAIEQNAENQEGIRLLVHDLGTNIVILTDLRQNRSSDSEELDRPLKALIESLREVEGVCKTLSPVPGAAWYERAFKACKDVYNAKSMEKKIEKLRSRVLFLQGTYTAITVTHANEQTAVQSATLDRIAADTSRVAALEETLQSVLKAVQNDSGGSRKVFAIDELSQDQRKIELDKTTLELEAVSQDRRRQREKTTIDLTHFPKDFKLLIIQAKIDTLKDAIGSNAPTIKSDSNDLEEYTPTPDDPFYKVHYDATGFWRRQDALVETVALLDELQDPRSMEASALVMFIRADTLSWSLGSLGLRKEALHLCLIAHDVIQKLSKSDFEFYRGYLAKSLHTLSICRGDMGELRGALSDIESAVEIYRALVVNDNSKFRLSLANSLQTLSNQLRIVGKRNDALSAIQETVEIYRALAAVDPEAINPNFALSLNNLSNRLRNVGKRDEAHPPSQGLPYGRPK